jgi:hypothetical protein
MGHVLTCELAYSSALPLSSGIKNTVATQATSKRPSRVSKSVLRDGGLFFAALHRGPKTQWVKTLISGMERDTYVQEWVQTDIEAVVLASGFKIIASRPFERKGGRYPLFSILAHT